MKFYRSDLYMFAIIQLRLKISQVTSVENEAIGNSEYRKILIQQTCV